MNETTKRTEAEQAEFDAWKTKVENLLRKADRAGSPQRRQALRDEAIRVYNEEHPA